VQGIQVVWAVKQHLLSQRSFRNEHHVGGSMYLIKRPVGGHWAEFHTVGCGEGPGEKLQLLGGRYLLAPSASHERDEADAKGSSCCDHDGR
jgi:hypothetical protein